MLAGGITESIMHFIGYLRTVEDIARERPDYDGSSLRNVPEDYVGKRLPPDGDITPDDIDITGTRGPPPLALNDLAAKLGMVRPHQAPGTHAPDDDDHGANPRLPGLLSAGGGGGGGRSLEITVSYEEDSSQSVIDIHQLNFMSNNNIIGIDATQAAPHLAAMVEAADTVLRSMADHANASIPQDWWMNQNTSGAIDFVAARDQTWAINDATPNPHSVQMGHYIDGVLQEQASGNSPRLELPPLPEAQDHGNTFGQWADLGSNYSANAAVIVDAAEASRTMLVLGNYYQTDAIFQTNSLISRDNFSISGEKAAPVLVGNDTMTNSADFAQHPGVYASLPAYFAGPQWTVDIVHGNYYDVRGVVQTNILSDVDIVGQESSSSHYEIKAGGNILENLTQILDGSVIQYDLIIIGGAYHGLNVIFQNNILLSESQVAMFADGLNASQSALGGHNNLSNDATIAHYGSDNFQPMNPNLASVVDEIDGGATSLGAKYGTYFEGSGGPIHVLYVTGDYYDINAIWQVNVTSDINVMAQLVGAPSDALSQALHQDGSVTQSVITGHNILANAAVIVDVGPTTTHVGGDVYSDALMVQANLLPSAPSILAGADVHSLVPELIAFVTDDHETTHAAPTSPAAAAPHDDPVACVLH